MFDPVDDAKTTKFWAVFLLTFAGFAGLYLLSLTSVHTYDALSYILDVDRKPWPELFHPHHLAYGPLGALIRGVAMSLGWQGSAERLLQGTNALAGALGVALFALVVRRSLGPASGTAAFLGALLLGSSYAYWYYAVEVEVYTIAALFLIAALGLMLALLRRPSLGLAAALGLAQALAVLFHQTNLLLTVPALVALLAPGRDRAAMGRMMAYGLPLGLIVGGAYLGVGLGVSSFRSWEALYVWAAGYTTTGFWGGPLDGSRLWLMGRGIMESLADPGGFVVALALLGTLLLSITGLRVAPRGATAICLSWLAVYGAFFFWWEPENIEFWIASLPPFYMLALLAVHGNLQALRNGGYSALLVCGLLMLSINWFSIRARSDADLDRQRYLTRFLAKGSAPGDLLVAPDGVVELYLPFYEGRPNVTSLSQAMTAAGGDWPAACRLLRNRIDVALAGGYEVRVADEALRLRPAPLGEPPTPAERFGLSAAEVENCYKPYQAAFEQRSPASRALLPGYARIPAAQELADGAGWDFRRGVWGWRVANVAKWAADERGVVLRPGIDPTFKSPPLRIEATQYTTIELRLAATTAARDAQIFFLDEKGRSDEARSLRWTLQAGPEIHTYRLDLRGTPGWQGIVGGLRIDPVGVGDGGTVVVEWVRLVP